MGAGGAVGKRHSCAGARRGLDGGRKSGIRPWRSESRPEADRRSEQRNDRLADEPYEDGGNTADDHAAGDDGGAIPSAIEPLGRHDVERLGQGVGNAPSQARHWQHDDAPVSLGGDERRGGHRAHQPDKVGDARQTARSDAGDKHDEHRAGGLEHRSRAGVSEATDTA